MSDDVTVDDLDAVKDAALRCVKAIQEVCAFGRTRFGTSWSPSTGTKGALTAPATVKEPSPSPPAQGGTDWNWLCWMSPTTRAVLHALEQQGKSKILACCMAAEKMRPLYTDEIRNVLLLADGTPKAYDQALEVASRIHELLFVSEFPVVKEAYRQHQMNNANLSASDRLRKFLEELSGPGRIDYWFAVQAHAAKMAFKHKEHQEAIENKFSAAIRLLEGKKAAPASADSADNKKIFPHGVPEDVNVIALAVAIHEEQNKPKSEQRSNNQIAREYVGKTGLNPDSLLRQVRRATK